MRPGEAGPGVCSCLASCSVCAVSADRKGCAGGELGREVEPLALCGAPDVSVTGRNAQRIKTIVALVATLIDFTEFYILLLPLLSLYFSDCQ